MNGGPEGRSLEDTQYCREQFAAEAEEASSAESLLGGSGKSNDSGDEDDESVEEAESEKVEPTKEEVHQLVATLIKTSNALDKMKGMNFCAGKVMDAADSINGEMRKLERERIRAKQNKPSRQAGIQPFIFKSGSSREDNTAKSSKKESKSLPLPASSSATAASSKPREVIDLSMDTNEDISAAPPSEVDLVSPPPKLDRKQTNAHWVVSECWKVGKDSHASWEIAHTVVYVVNELKKLDLESINAVDVYMKAFGDERSGLFQGEKRNMQFIHAMAEKSNDLVEDESFTPDLLDKIIENEGYVPTVGTLV